MCIILCKFERSSFLNVIFFVLLLLLKSHLHLTTNHKKLILRIHLFLLFFFRSKSFLLTIYLSFSFQLYALLFSFPFFYLVFFPNRCFPLQIPCLSLFSSSFSIFRSYIMFIYSTLLLSSLLQSIK